MLNRLFAFLLTSFTINIVVADTEFTDSVPLDLVQALLGNTPYGEPIIYSDLSSSFPDIPIPNSFQLLGSIDRGYGNSAVYRTELTPDQIDSTLAEILLQADYIDFELPGMRPAEQGFVQAAANAPRKFNRYCHNSYGFLSHSYVEKKSSGIVTLSTSTLNDNRSCEEQLEEQQLTMGPMGRQGSGLEEHLPRMELPETEPVRGAYSPFFRVGGYSGSRNGIESKADLTIDWSIEEVFTHFSEQIDNQGWVVDTSNIGSTSATGIWTKSHPTEGDLVGTLSVLKVSDESFELKFLLSIVGGRRNSNFGVFRSY